MAITATDVATLNSYAQGVLGRADHHAKKVEAVALALLGGIVWRADPGSIEIKQYDGALANVLWIKVQGRRYAFAYNHVTQKIEIREGTVRGVIRHAFDDTDPLTTIFAAVSNL